MKKMISYLAALALVFGTAAALPQGAARLDGAITASAETSGDYDYTILDDGTVKIQFYNGSGSAVSIPATLGGRKVTMIDSYAFFFHEEITSVTIPEGVTEIGENAFKDCTALKSVKLPSTLKAIGGYAFQNCKELSSISLPAGLESIGMDAFEFCSALPSSLAIPAGVSEIGSYAFNETPWLSAQQAKSPLVIVNGILLDASTCTGDVVIPSSVKMIGAYAFFDCGEMTSVTIPKSVKSIGSYAFYGCSGLKEIKIPDSVTEIGDGAFEFCTGLTSVNIPGSVGVISFGAFRDCSALSSVTVGYGTTEIADWAFYDCTALKEITVPSSVKVLGPESIGYYFDDATISSVTNSSLTVYCEKGSAAESYAQSAGFKTADIPAQLPEDGVTLLGDADGNGKVSVDDVLLIQQKIAGWDVKVNFKNADIDGDNDLSVSDALAVQQIIAGWKIG